MKKPATYTLGMLMGLSTCAMTPSVVAAPTALGSAQLDAITVREFRTEATADAERVRFLAMTSERTTRAPADFEASLEQGAGAAVAIGRGDTPEREAPQSIAVSQTTQTPDTSSIGIESSTPQSEAPQSTAVSQPTPTPDSPSNGAELSAPQSEAPQSTGASPTTQPPNVGSLPLPQSVSLPDSIVSLAQQYNLPLPTGILGVNPGGF